MSFTQVVLIRHGESQGNAERRFGGHSLTPLSELGRRQAAATCRALATEAFAAIYTSDLPRATETATPLSEVTALELQPTEAFRERSVGVMAGLTFEEAAELHPQQYQALLRRDFEHVLLGGESYQNARQSVTKARRGRRTLQRWADCSLYARGNHLHSGTAPDGCALDAGAKTSLDRQLQLRDQPLRTTSRRLRSSHSYQRHPPFGEIVEAAAPINTRAKL